MARRQFQVIDVVEVLQHWHAGRPKTVVAASLGVDVKTVRKYVAAAEAAGIVPGDGHGVDRAGWAARVSGWFPELVDARARSLSWPVLQPHRELIESMMKTNTLATVHQRLRDEHGVAVSAASVRRYVALELPQAATLQRATVLRPDVPPGEAQIDYGYLGSWVDPVGGRVRRVQAFVIVLACSRHMFVQPVLSMDASSFIASHLAAFEFFGAVPTRLVTDNLKTGVLTADRYDPLINRGYAELAEHYGCLVDPARAVKPKDKPRVERMMQYVRDSFWRGRSFASVADMQARAAAWCTEIAGVRSHRMLEGASPLSVFTAAERPALLPLPAGAFVLARWVSPKVAPDCHIAIDKVLYSVPWRHIGQVTDTRVTDSTVQVHVRGELVKTWPRALRGRCTDPADYPPEKIAFFARNPVWCRTRAAGLGPHVNELVAGLLAVQALHRLRSAQGILGLADKHGPQALDAACAAALTAGDPSYRTVRGILALPHGTSADQATGPGAARQTDTTMSTPAHLHGPDGLLGHLPFPTDNGSTDNVSTDNVSTDNVSTDNVSTDNVSTRDAGAGSTADGVGAVVARAAAR